MNIKPKQLKRQRNSFS